MSDKYIFEYYDIKKGNLDLPECFKFWVNVNTHYADTYLSKFSINEVATISKDIDTFLENNAGELICTPHFISETPIILSDGKIEQYSRMSYIHIFASSIETDPKIVSSLANSWEEIFSALGVSIFAYAVRDSKFLLRNHGTKASELELISDYVNQAIEAITTARMLNSTLSKDEVERHSKFQNSKIASIGGNAKSLLIQPLKDEVLAIYKNDFYPLKMSNKKAASRIWDSLDNKIIQHPNDASRLLLNEHSAPDTIARWISTYKKEVL